MIKLAANLSVLFNEVDFLDRFGMAAEVGFKGVEHLFPYDYPATQLAQKLKDNDLQEVMFDIPAGNWLEGERGIACLPGRVNQFRDGVKLALEYATELNCKLLNVLAGGVVHQAEDHEQDRFTHTLTDNLRFAAELAQAADITILLEAANNKVDIPHYWINTTKEARTVIENSKIPNMKLQYDFYHMQIMEGNLANTIKENLSFIGHLQLSDVPGHGEPGTGEINFDFLLGFIDRLGYDGWIGCEYKPTANTKASLAWAEQWLKPRD